MLSLVALLGLLGLLLCFLCICCCRGNGTREVHTQENFKSKDTYLDEEVIEPMQEEEIIEEEVIEEGPPRVYQSTVREEQFVQNRPESVTYSNFRADEYKDNGNIYSNNSVVVENRVRQPVSTVEERVIQRSSYNPYREK